MFKTRNTSFWIYLLGVYILLQFLWWAWMLIDLNFQMQVLESSNNPETKIGDDFLNRKIAMIVGEGSVFILLLALGFYQVKKALRREIEAAKLQRNFLLSVTHELNSPLAGVQLNLETAINRNISEDKKRQLLQNALEQNGRLKNLVENILTSTRLDENVLETNKQKTDLSLFLQRLIDTYGGEANIAFQEKTTGQVFANIDTVLMESIMQNLIENAIKYSTEDAQVEIGLERLDNHAIVSVKDKGIGINPEHQNKIFNRFYRVQNEETRNTKGTGLGLFIAKQLAELMNGDLYVESKPNKGSTFFAKFPIV